MDPTVILNIAAVAISVAALTISVLLTRRQIQVATGANHVPVVVNAFQETRSAAWFEAQEYILHKLAKEHPTDRGHRDLPLPARTHANVIGLFYDDLGKLVAHGVIDQRLVIGAYGTTIVRLWDAPGALCLCRAAGARAALLDLFRGPGGAHRGHASRIGIRLYASAPAGVLSLGTPVQCHETSTSR